MVQRVDSMYRASMPTSLADASPVLSTALLLASCTDYAAETIGGPHLLAGGIRPRCASSGTLHDAAGVLRY